LPVAVTLQKEGDIMASRQIKNDRLIVLLLFGILALNYPLLAIFNKQILWFGIPVLYLYLFLAWALFIGLLACVMERGAPPESSQKSMKPQQEK